MMKTKFVLFLSFYLVFSYGQIGILNIYPKGTLDVNKSSYATGEHAGIAVTQLTASQIETMSTTDLKAGTLVYATTATGSTINALGYWYFSGSTWVNFSSSTSFLDTMGTLFQIGNEGDSPNVVTSVVTVLQLSAIIGITGVVVSNEVAYQSYIDANPNSFASPATVAEVQAMINAVNLSVVTSGGTATVSSYSCNSASSGSLMISSLASEVTQTITATVASVGTYNITATSNGVTFSGSGTFSGTGSQNVVLTATGTPVASGTHTFALNTTPTCSFSRVTNAIPTIPGSIILGQNKTSFVTSIFDQDYLPYTAPIVAATTNVQAANGSNESVTLNVQGTITTTGRTVYIPVTATASGTLPAYFYTIAIPSSATQDGVGRNVTLSWSAQSYTTSTKAIVATIRAVGGTLNVKKLDLNAGVGNDVMGVLIGSFSYPYNNSGSSTTFDIRAIAGVPDKMFGVADNSGNASSHLMLYEPVDAEDGTIWLNNNLGAHYANINHSNFNFTQQATTKTDHLAYGSLFQWGRKPDGHELINYTSATSGTPVNGTITELSNNPTHSNFILNPSGTNNSSWRINNDFSLWLSESSENNPCPKSYRLATLINYDNLFSTGIANGDLAFNSRLKFSYIGLRSAVNGSFLFLSTRAIISTSSISGTSSVSKSMANTSILNINFVLSSGLCVRCIKN
jgi:hypothetical protein